MTLTEIKNDFHHLIDEIEDIEVLEMFFESLKNAKENKGTDFWDELTEEHQKELEESWKESENPEKLIPHEEVMKKTKKWLKG